MTNTAKCRLELLGPFRLFGPDGARIELASKRGQALVAMLSVASGGERTRSWLQDRLWGSRQHAQAQASLRRELSNLRKVLDQSGASILDANHNSVRLDLTRIEVDARDLEHLGDHGGEFLEGLDLPGEDTFEDWLREQRQQFERLAERDGAGQVRLPKTIVDLSEPVPGFRGRQAIAVLPLENLTTGDDFDYLADGISEELIERLSRLKWLPVIARSASFHYRARPVDLREIGQSLGVRYVLDGWIRQAESTFRLSLNMADVETGLTMWTHASEVPVHFDKAVVDDLILEIVGVMDMKIDAAEKLRAIQKSESELTVEDLIWRGRWHLHRYKRADSVLAEKYFLEALGLEPNSPEALVQMTFFYARSIWTERKGMAEMRDLRQFAQRAIVADGEDGRGYMFAGMAELWMRRTSQALQLFERAVELNPSLSLAHMQIGSAYILAGNPEAAIAPLKMALRLGPSDEHTFNVLGELAIAHCMLGNWDEAIKYADQTLLRRVSYWYAHSTKINALVRKGSLVEAEFVLNQLFEAKPDFTMEYVDWLPFVDRKWIEFIKSGLRMAGMT